MYTPSEFGKKVGVTVHTLQRWDREGRLVAKRTHTNRRYYTEEDAQRVLGQSSKEQGITVVYCRVSSVAQKPDLANQRRTLEQFCAARGMVVDEWIEEIGGGLNFKRKRFLKLIDRIVGGEVSTLVLAHEDRLARFGFDLMEHLCERVGCELVVMNTESLSPEREMVEDLMTIVHCFSSRLYGLRNYRKSLKKALYETSFVNDTQSPDTSESNA